MMAEEPDAVSAEVLQKLQPLGGQVFHPIQKLEHQLRERLSPEEMNRHWERILDATCAPSLREINTIFSAIVVLSGLGATLLGGMVGDRLRPRFSGSYFLVSGVSMLIAFPMILLVLTLPFPAAWAFIFMAVFFLFFNTGPTNTILANVTHPAIRSTAFALNIFLIHVLGDTMSPVVMGRIADRYSMDAALASVSMVILVGGVLWLWGARYLERDTLRAWTQLDGSDRTEPLVG
jgi:MFS family permease